MSEPTTDYAIIKLPSVRLSFPHLFKPHAVAEGQEPKFGATFILDNQIHGRLLDQIEALIERVSLDFFKKKVRLTKTCLRDGNDYPDKDGYGDGVMFIPANVATRPVVVNRDKTPIMEEDGIIYAGCYVNASIRLYAWEHKVGGRGVSAGLRAVQFVKDGESFGAGKVDADKEFDPLPDEDGDPAFN